jgi:hypothetical protein
MRNVVTSILPTQHEHNRLHSSLVALLIATRGAMLQIEGECYDVAPYIVYLPESFFTFSHTVLYSGVIIIDQRMTQL